MLELAAVRRIALIAFAAALSLLSAQVSHAATITVDSNCPFAAAITSANNDSNNHDTDCEAGSGADTIEFELASQNVTLSATQTISSEITINGQSARISTNFCCRAFLANPGAKLTLNNLFVVEANIDTSSDPDPHGAGIKIQAGAAVTLNGVSFYDSYGGSGVGIYSRGTLIVTKSTFTGLFGELSGGGKGGAIYIESGNATISRSRFINNTGPAGGGAIYVAGGALQISNSTIDSNSASAGGGIYQAGGATTASHVTIYDNTASSATSSDASGLHVAGGSVQLRNSIIAGTDSNVDCGGSGGLSQNVGNLIEDNTCSPAASGAANLFQQTGGPLYAEFYLPKTGSPALGIGDAAVCKSFPLDARARPYPRPASGCDAGTVVGGINIIYVNANANNDPDTVCTLSEAFASANEDSADNAPGCWIGFADSTATDLILLAQDVTLSGGVTDPTTDIILDGDGYTVSKESSAGDFRAITVETNGNLTMRNISMSGFRVTSGAAVLNKARLTLEDCVFKDNVDDSGSAGGGAVRIEPANTGTVIDRCLFEGNESLTAKGGAILVSGGDVTIRNSAFKDNDSVSDSGGAIFFEGGSSTVHNNTFIGNTCSGSGCAVFNNGGTVDLTHNTFWDNTSDTSGNTDTLYHGSGTSYWHNSIMGYSAARTNPVCGGNPPGGGLENGRVVWNGPEAHGCGLADVVAVGDPKFGAETGSPPYLPLGAGSAASGAGINAYCAAVPIDAKGDPRPATGCDAGAVQGPTAGAPGGKSDSASSAASEYVGTAAKSAEIEPPVSTGELLNNTGNYRISVSYGLSSGVQFNRLELSAIGIGYVIEAGPLDAIDVWGWVTRGVEVCFKRRASTLFLDAANSPRTVEQLASTWDGVWTCVEIDRAGTIVLMPADSYLTTAPAIADSLASPAGTTQLVDCMVELLYALNFRETPGGAIMMQLPHRIRLTAFQRTADWVEVDYHGIRGWISAHHVTFLGSC